MATIDTLQAEYRNVMRVQAIPAADATTLNTLAAQVDGSGLSLSAATDAIVHMAINTTTVATFAYNFFTGATPRAAGLDYLVSPTGPNPNNINSAFYQAYNLTNRYIDFSVNLGKFGEGAPAFAANYGALSLADATAKAYTEIFGTVPDAAKVSAILNAQVPNGLGGTFTRAEYFAVYGKDGLTGIGTKAAMVGWLLGDAAVENIGAYAAANNAFLTDLAPDGAANFNVNLVAAYGPPPSSTPGATITFAHDQSVSTTATDVALRSTANADLITGSAGLDAGQSVQAGSGADTINIPGVVFGQIQTSDGSDIVTIGGLRATVATLGVPAQYGSVVLSGGNNSVHLNGPMDQGTSISATGTGNTLYLGGTGGNSQVDVGSVSGFQTLIVQTDAVDSISFTGLQTVYDRVGAGLATTTQIALPGATQVYLQNTSYGVTVGYANVANAEIHLDHFTGAPTTVSSLGSASFHPSANGGAILASGVTQTLTLHVDSNSTAGLILGYSFSNVAGTPVGRLANNLVIDGSGALTAQLSTGFINIDAHTAGDLNLSYAIPSQFFNGSVRSPGIFQLSNGTDTLTVDMSVTQVDAMKFVFGTGADNFVISAFSNLGITNQTVNAPDEIDGFKKGTDHVVLDGVVHAITTGVQQYADGQTSLSAALISVSAHVGANTAAIFAYAGDTYIYLQDSVVGVDTFGTAGGAGDGLIKLVGVTGLTTATGAAVGDIHYG